MSATDAVKADRRAAGQLRAGAPDAFAAFAQLNGHVASEEAAIPRRYRELIAIGVALTTQCTTCLDAHVRAAKQAGATEQEVAETTYIAAAIRAGGAVVHGRLALRQYDEATGG